MIKVLDKNVLEKSSLEIYLVAGNKGILFEHSFIEMAQGGDPRMNFQKSFTILGKYTNNIFISKNLYDIETLVENGFSPSFENLIDNKASKNFNAFSQFVLSGSAFSDKIFIEQLEKSKISLNYWNDSAKQVREWLIRPEYLSLHRRNMKDFFANYSEESTKFLWDEVFKWTRLLREKAGWKPLPKKNILNSYIFRFVLFCVLLCFYYLDKSGSNITKSGAFANDITDMTYCTIGSYFDGILSEEKKVLTLFKKGMQLLKALKESLDNDS